MVVIVIVVMTLVVMVVIVVVLFLGRLALGLGAAAAQHALAAGLGGAAVGAATGRDGGLGGRHDRQALVGQPAHDDRDVAGALADAGGAAAGPGAPALERRALVGVAGRHEELVGGQAVVVLGVGDGRVEALEDHPGDVALGELEDLEGPGDGLATDEVEDLAGLVGRRADVLDLGADARALVGLGAGHQRRPFFSWPAWCRKVRVGANSPSLCPTIDSVM